jgi:hypothetical protein
LSVAGAADLSACDVRHKLVTSRDAAGPSDTTAVQAELIRLGRIYPFKANSGRTDGERVAVNDPWRAR